MDEAKLCYETLSSDISKSFYLQWRHRKTPPPSQLLTKGKKQINRNVISFLTTVLINTFIETEGQSGLAQWLHSVSR